MERAREKKDQLSNRNSLENASKKSSRSKEAIKSEDGERNDQTPANCPLQRGPKKEERKKGRSI